MFLPAFVDHLVFRVRDMDRTERFYTVLLEEPFKADGYIMYMAGDTRLFFTPSVDHASPYNKENVGLNHIALGVRTIEELQRVESQLNGGSVTHSGIKLWQDGLTKYIWLDDPDGIRVLNIGYDFRKNPLCDEERKRQPCQRPGQASHAELC